jgi:hypothetical protein
VNDAAAGGDRLRAAGGRRCNRGETAAAVAKAHGSVPLDDVVDAPWPAT